MKEKISSSSRLLLLKMQIPFILQELKNAQENFKQTMPAAEEEFRSILALGNEAAELAKGAENPYTLITTTVCSSSVYFYVAQSVEASAQWCRAGGRKGTQHP